MENQDQFDGWVNSWENAQKKWAAEDAANPPPQTKSDKSKGFFGVHSQALPDDKIDREQSTDWTSIYSRSTELRDEPNTNDGSDQMFQEQSSQLKKLLGPVSVPSKAKPKIPVVNPTSTFQEQAEGWRNLLSQPGKDTTFFHNPQHYASIGMDQGKSPYEPTRVTPNFSSGKELDELAEMKNKLSKLEATLLAQEIKAGKSDVPYSSYKSKLDVIRKQIDDLSDKLTPDPASDVS
jgi:hypothetical protein